MLRKALKSVYQASDLTEAGVRWGEVKAEWSALCPLVIDSWERNWDTLMGPMQYPDIIRELTNGIKLVDICHDYLVQYTKEDITEAEIQKALYATSLHTLSKYRAVINNWGFIIQQLGVIFDERVKKHLTVTVL